MPASTLDIVALGAGYGSKQVIENLSLSVAAGERLAILGRNGMGKTTLLSSIMGLTRPGGGSIRLDGVEISALRPSERARRGVGLVPQARDVFRSLTVAENLAAGLKDRPRDAIDEAYEMFPRLKERHRHLGLQLSGGEQQMLSTARALLGRPTLLLLDEPLEGLAPVVSDALMETLSRLASERGMTVILVEQRIEAALQFAERVLILERGRVVFAGTGAELRADDQRIDRHIGIGALD